MRKYHYEKVGPRRVMVRQSLALPLGPALFYMFASFVLGASTVLLVSMNRPPATAAAARAVICESGSQFKDPKENDPYYVESMDCNLGNPNGPVVRVTVID